MIGQSPAPYSYSETQIVLALEVVLEQAIVFCGHEPSLCGLCVSKKDNSPRFPHILAPPRSVMVIGSFSEIDLMQ